MEDGMAPGQMSVGDDTPDGEPENGPRGPYITDKDDGTPKPDTKPDTKKDNKEDSDQRRDGDSLPSRTETAITRESELGSDG
jgi:hypothetical protein